MSNNGALTFSRSINSFSLIEFPNSVHQFVAPYWADVDTRGTGEVTYRETADPDLLDKAARYVRLGFMNQQEFHPSHLFIATWDGVGYYEENTDKVCSYATCTHAHISAASLVAFMWLPW